MKYVFLALFLSFFVSPVIADDVIYYDALTLELGCALGPPLGFPSFVEATSGTPLSWVGRVSNVGKPFDDLVPLGYELTYAFEGSKCTVAGSWDDAPCGRSAYGYFEGGTLTIYLDASPDADFTNLSTFHDGDAVLIAETSVIHMTDDDPYLLCPNRPDDPDASAFLHVVGGSWFDRASQDGHGFYGASWGEVDQSVPPRLLIMGYAFRADGVIDLYSTVATTPTTWGAVKALYHR